MPVASRRQLFSCAHRVAPLLWAVRGVCHRRLPLSMFRLRSVPFLAMVSLVTDVDCASGCDRSAPRLGTTAALRRSLLQWLSATGQTLGLVCAHVALPSIVTCRARARRETSSACPGAPAVACRCRLYASTGCESGWGGRLSTTVRTTVRWVTVDDDREASSSSRASPCMDSCCSPSPSEECA